MLGTGEKYWNLILDYQEPLDMTVRELAIDSLIGALLAYENYETIGFDYLDGDISSRMYNEDGEFNIFNMEMVRDPKNYRDSLYYGTTTFVRNILLENHHFIQQLYSVVNIRDVIVSCDSSFGRLCLLIVGIEQCNK